MRKYRGLTKDGTWVYGWYVERFTADTDYQDTTAHIEWIDNKNELRIEQVIPETVGQFTGLCDDKEREVYEHDQYRGKRTGTIYTVVFRDDGYALVYDSKSPPIKERYECGLYYALNSLDLEYISNIHSKPDLMEKSNGQM